ncbi:MAG: DUF4173 domain-containing protein [Anaerolineales bacterium]|nr:DUF4173 domain-containing protein [Anaerolineales bacterium]
MKIPFPRLLIFVLVLGWVFDLMFWNAGFGVNFPLFVLLVLAGGYLLLRQSEIFPAKAAWWLVIPIALLGAATLFRAEPLSRSLAVTAVLLSLSILAVTYQGGRWLSYGLADYFGKSLDLFGTVMVRTIEHFVKWRKEPREVPASKGSFPWMPILRGVAIAVPVVGIFLALLTSADVIFYERVVHFFDLFSFDKSVEYFFQLLLILFVAFVLAGVFLHAGMRSGDAKLYGEQEPLVKPFFGFIETSIVLGSVTLLFLAFVVIQFQYFFGGNANIGVAGYTYSEYARRGFSELVTVGLISLFMIMGFSTVTKRENDLQKRVYSILSTAIVALVVVMLISAYQRLTLAISWHGYSRLRLYPKVFMIWVGILFVAVVILEWFHKERHFALAFLLAAMGFVVTLNVINVDAEIVRVNVQRATAGFHFNPEYLASLSWDAMPALTDAFQTTSQTDVREGIGAAIICLGYEEAQRPPMDWRSFTFARWRAQLAYDTVEGQLQAYTLNKSYDPPRVRTPSEVYIFCPYR